MSKNSLHLLRTSPFQDNQIKLMLSCLTQHDTVVLLDDGCYLNNHPMLTKLVDKTRSIFAISSHISARALITQEPISLISLTEFNEMLFRHINSVTWQ